MFQINPLLLFYILIYKLFKELKKKKKIYLNNITTFYLIKKKKIITFKYF